MKAATIENEKDRPAGVVHQALQELDKGCSVDGAFYLHEALLAACAHCRDHVQRTALPRAPHHGRLALDAPGRCCMTVRPHSRFVAKIDFGSFPPGLLGNGREHLWAALPNPFRLLLHGSE